MDFLTMFETLHHMRQLSPNPTLINLFRKLSFTDQTWMRLAKHSEIQGEDLARFTKIHDELSSWISYWVAHAHDMGVLGTHIAAAKTPEHRKVCKVVEMLERLQNDLLKSRSVQLDAVDLYCTQRDSRELLAPAKASKLYDRADARRGSHGARAAPDPDAKLAGVLDQDRTLLDRNVSIDVQEDMCATSMTLPVPGHGGIGAEIGLRRGASRLERVDSVPDIGAGLTSMASTSSLATVAAVMAASAKQDDEPLPTLPLLPGQDEAAATTESTAFHAAMTAAYRTIHKQQRGRPASSSSRDINVSVASASASARAASVAGAVPLQPGAIAAAAAVLSRPGTVDSLAQRPRAETPSTARRRLMDQLEVEKQRRRLYQEERYKTGRKVALILDYYLLAQTVTLTILVLCDYLKQREQYTRQVGQSTRLASHFIGTGMPMLERLLAFEPELFATNVLEKSTKGISKGKVNQIWCAVVYRVRVLDQLFATVDVYLFPRTIRCHTRGVRSIGWSHKAPSVIVTGGHDRHIALYDTSNRTAMGQFVGHRSIITKVVFSSDDTWIVSASSDHTLQIWDSQTAHHIRTLYGHTDGVTDCDINKNDSIIASCSMDRTIRLWDPAKGTCFRMLKGHRAWVKCVRFTPEADKMISCGLDNSLYIWPLSETGEDGKPLRPTVIDGAHDEFPLDMKMREPNLLLTCSRDRTLKLWDYNTGKLLRTHRGLLSWACSVTFSPDGKHFACASFDNYIFVFHTKSGQMIRQMNVHNDGILVISWAPNGHAILVGTSGGLVQIIPT